MVLEHVKAHFKQWNIDDRIMELEATTATVADAAAAHGVEAGQIGKTLSFKIDDEPILIVVAGDAKIANTKYKARFAKKAKMLTPDEVLTYTGHPVGGVCPFGLPRNLSVYLNISLKRFEDVIPAAGSHNSSIRLSLEELEQYSDFRGWIDVCKIIEQPIKDDMKK
ncbi:MAG: YbaK/EbsC family protein [Spirochaetes bacterium]|nr:MAG: YbaK/EbsC family protein [Spirochaetota bacterium]